jgi:hypothetical protein
MKENDFVFTIGYQGDTAIVDGKAQKRFRGQSVEELIESGMYKAAFCKALYHEDTSLQEKVLKAYNEKSGADYASVEDLKRLFGVFGIPEEVSKVTVV